MMPFGHTVLLWRTSKGLTQSELARRASVPRPNLSAIESGKRDVTLSTLRALAAALGVKPGVLADGEPPAAPSNFSRPALERIAESVAAGRRSGLSASERSVAHAVAALMQNRLSALRGTRLPRRRLSHRRARAAAGAALPPNVLRSLIKRVTERAS